MTRLFAKMIPPVRSEDVVKLAVGPKKARDLSFTTWEALLSEIIVGDAFGVDRIDYLLRDSYHAGVAYGRFDHFRLFDTLRILPLRSGPEDRAPAEPALGIEEGGIDVRRSTSVRTRASCDRPLFRIANAGFDSSGSRQADSQTNHTCRTSRPWRRLTKS